VLPEIVTPDISLAMTPETEKTDVIDQSRENDSDASLAFREQLEALRRSEDLARQRETAKQPSSPQPTLPEGREDRIALWKRHGMTDRQAEFLRENPAMIDRSDLTGIATSLAHQQGYKSDSPEFLEITKTHFNGLRMQEEQAQLRSHAAPPAVEPMPEEYSMPPSSSPSVGYSAPVTRDVPTGTYHGERRLSRITLSAQEKEIARLSGVSQEEYALGKLELMRRKEAGEIG
jgi:hypothetical protein